jgi:formylglycine-generating enzyme required for sulfatase activity
VTRHDEQVLAELAKALDRGELVFFVGAGVSAAHGAQPGLPLARETSRLLAEELLGRSLQASDTLMHVAQEAVWLDRGSRHRLEGLLTRIFANNRIGALPAHSALASIGAPIITTNYDNLIERAYQARGKAVSVAWKDVHTTAMAEPVLIKIHGTIEDPGSCVITEDDYYHWLDREPELRDIVRGYLLTKTLCFVGYSIADPNFRAMLRILRLKFASIRRPGLLVTQKLDPDSYDHRYVSQSLGLSIYEADATSFLQSLERRGARAAFTDISKSEGVRQGYFANSSGKATFADYAADVIVDTLTSGSAPQKWSIDADILTRVRSHPRLSSSPAATASPDIVDGFTRIHAGPFIAGGQRHGNELIRIEMIHRPYRIAIHAVTNAEYREFSSWCYANNHPRTHCHPDEPASHDHAPTWQKAPHDMGPEYLTDATYDRYPVVFVDWWDAYAYCAWRGGRLPTDLEWERAARGVDGRIYPWGDEFKVDFCNTEESKRNQPVPVDAYLEGRSPCGTLQMSGNVWEWCDDPFSDDHQSFARVTRGGSFSRGASRAEVAFRNGRAPGDRWCTRGFRLAFGEDYE